MTPRYPQKRRLRTLIVRWLLGCVAAGALIGSGIAYAGHAHADTASPVACHTDNWGLLGSQRRTLCDSAIRPDGSWMRGRVIWTPAHQVPLTCFSSGGNYISSTNCSGGYFAPESVQDNETYPVRPNTVLPDEPGHIS